MAERNDKSELSEKITTAQKHYGQALKVFNIGVGVFSVGMAISAGAPLAAPSVLYGLSIGANLYALKNDSSESTPVKA